MHACCKRVGAYRSDSPLPHKQEQSLAGSLSALPGNGSYASGTAIWNSGAGVKGTASGGLLGGHRRSRELSALASGHSSGRASLELEAASRHAPAH